MLWNRGETWDCVLKQPTSSEWIRDVHTERVEKVTDIVKEGDEIIVKCLGIDKRGRLNFSRKAAIK